MKKIILIITIALMLTACSASYDANSTGLGAIASAPKEMSMGRDEYGETQNFAADTAGGGWLTEIQYSESPQSQPAPDISVTDPFRKLIRTANLSVETQEFEDSIANLEALCAVFQGYIESSSIDGRSITVRGKSYRMAQYTFRIPSKFYNEFLNSIGSIGNVINKAQESRDVTDSYYDIESRLKILEMRRDRLYGLLEKETNSKSIIEFENSLSDTLYEIERMTGTLRSYDSLVDYSTVHIYMSEVEEYTEVTPYAPAPRTVGERVSSSFGDSLENLGEFFVNIFVFIVGNILYIIIWLAVLAGVFYGTMKFLRKRKNPAVEIKKDNEGEK
ncbi:MAG: DUF4349 domain-containing protein [Oscillospiraceae bacterium]|nr:DUF4349 domain-containing protein [Oscillospiraceae bacterium]